MPARLRGLVLALALLGLAPRGARADQQADITAAQKLYDEGKAFHWWSEALVEDPRWERALEESERLAQKTAAWDDIVAAYTRALERTTDRDVKRLTIGEGTSEIQRLVIARQLLNQ